MTNVPKEIRNAWADVYKLFDISFNIDGSEEAWKQYWERANQVIQKYGDEIPLLEITVAIAHMLQCFINQRKTGNKSITWNKDEDYPHPRV